MFKRPCSLANVFGALLRVRQRLNPGLHDVPDSFGVVRWACFQQPAFILVHSAARSCLIKGMRQKGLMIERKIVVDSDTGEPVNSPNSRFNDLSGDY